MGAGLTKRQARGRLEFWIRRFGLQTWDFRFVWGVHLDDEAEAQVHVHDDYADVLLRFAHGWQEWDERKFDCIIVHELLHVVLHDMDVAQRSVYDALSHDAKTMLSRRYRHEEERAVEWLAQRIVDIERGQTR